MLKCILIDDEPNAISLLDILISDATNWQVIARCYNGLEALQAIKANPVNFIFLDINMPLLNGMELAALLPKDIKIVFTTAYSEHAAESYLHEALDYILKPITLKRFLTAQQKIETWFSNAAQVSHTLTGDQQNDHLFVKTGKSLQKVQLQDILYIEGDKEYIKLITVTAQLLVYRRLKEVEEQLKYPFVRVHNSYIINMEKIENFTDNHILIGGQKIPVSSKYRNQFMGYLNNKLF